MAFKTALVQRREYAKQLFAEAGFKNITMVTKNVMFSCPLAPYTDKHKSNSDSTPSMGVLVRDDGACLVNCFTCKWKARSLLTLFEYLATFNRRYSTFLERVQKVDYVDMGVLIEQLPEYGDMGLKRTRWSVPESEYAGFPKGRHKYLAERGISKLACEAWEAGYDTYRHRVVFPVRDFDGTLVGGVGRTVNNHQIKYLNYFEFKKGRHLFGAHLCQRDRPTLLVEGVLDAVAAWQHAHEEFNVVALLGSEMHREQVDQILDWSSEIVLGHDNDKAGLAGARQALALLGRRTKVWKLMYEEGDAPDPAGLGGILMDRLQTVRLCFPK